MIVLPNMGLTKWESINDNFSHEQLAANFTVLDEHNHTTGKGAPIAYGGLAEQSVGIENIRSGVLTAVAEQVTVPVKYYSKSIATEESRTNTAFGTFTTADQVTGVVVPANGILLLNYIGLLKNSVAEAGRIAWFIGANQLKQPQVTAPIVSEKKFSVETSFQTITSAPNGEGFIGGNTGTSLVTTGMTGGIAVSNFAGACFVYNLAAGTYTVSVQTKSSSGSITAKERTTTVAVLG